MTVRCQDKKQHIHRRSFIAHGSSAKGRIARGLPLCVNTIETRKLADAHQCVAFCPGTVRALSDARFELDLDHEFGQRETLHLQP